MSGDVEIFPFSNLDKVSFESCRIPITTQFRERYPPRSLHNESQTSLKLIQNPLMGVHYQFQGQSRNQFLSNLKRALNVQIISDSLLFDLYQEAAKLEIVRSLNDDELNCRHCFINLLINEQDYIICAFQKLINQKPNIVYEIKQNLFPI